MERRRLEKHTWYDEDELTQKLSLGHSMIKVKGPGLDKVLC